MDHGEHAGNVLMGINRGVGGQMKAWQVACIAGVIASTGLYLAAGNRTVATVPDAMPEAAVNAVTTYAPALSAAVPTVSAGPGTTLAAEDGLVTASVSDALMARAEIAGYSIGPKLASLGHQDVAQPAPATQDFRYLIYYVSSELPPAEKPAEIV